MVRKQPSSPTYPNIGKNISWRAKSTEPLQIPYVRGAVDSVSVLQHALNGCESLGEERPIKICASHIRNNAIGIPISGAKPPPVEASSAQTKGMAIQQAPLVERQEYITGPVASPMDIPTAQAPQSAGNHSGYPSSGLSSHPHEGQRPSNVLSSRNQPKAPSLTYSLPKEKFLACPFSKHNPSRYLQVYNSCTERPGFRDPGKPV
jgi:hypothetical protein